MKTKTVQLDEQTRAVLLRSTINGCNLQLPGQLPRDEYTKVAKAIEAAGGKWVRKMGCHVFPDDVRETLNIGAENVEVVNVQQTFQAFNTPDDIASQMVQWADLVAGDKVLEPSAGTGQLLKAARSCGIFKDDLTAIEINPKQTKQLEAIAGKVICADFMECDLRGVVGIGDSFHHILMNPPFTRGQDVEHIKHALTFLKRGGRLVAICGNGSKQREALLPLSLKWLDLPADSFKSSGTGVSTALVVIEA